MDIILNFAKVIVVDFWSTLSEMSVYLLFGFFAAGVISVWLSAEFVETHLGGGGFWPVVKATLLGIPLPLCSCGVIPVAMSLRKHGASKGASVAFLLSTPQTGVDSFFVTYSLLGTGFAIFRPIIALVTGLIGGFGIQFFDPETAKESLPLSEPGCSDEGCPCKKKSHKILNAFKYGFITLPRDIGGAMFVGLVIAALISAAVPKDFFADKLGTGIFAMLVMMALGIPVYVCATASVPIAAALIAKGLTPGAAFVFLMTGPATNAAGFVTIWKVLGAKTALIYLLSVAVCALGAGLLLDSIALNIGVGMIHHSHFMIPEAVKYASAIVLLGVLGYAMYNKKRGGTKTATL